MRLLGVVRIRHEALMGIARLAERLRSPPMGKVLRRMSVTMSDRTVLCVCVCMCMTPCAPHSCIGAARDGVLSAF